MRLNGALLTVAACLVLLVTGSAIAADELGDLNASLEGKFRFSLDKTCADVQLGFTDPPGRLAKGVGYTPTSSLRGSIPTMATVTS